MIDFKTIFMLIIVLFKVESSFAKAEFVIQKNNQTIKLQPPYFNDFNEQFEKDIKSGLSVKIVQIVRFNDKKRKINIYQNMFTIRYDIWDEIFLFKEANLPIKKIKDIGKLHSELKSKSEKLIVFDTKKITLDRDFFFESSFVINPISKEKSGIIKKWMAEKFVGPSSQEVGSETNSFIAGMVNTVVQSEIDKNIFGADKHVLSKSKKINFKTMDFL